MNDNEKEFVSNRRRRYRLDKIEKLDNKTSGPGIKNSSKSSSKKQTVSQDILINEELKLPSLNASNSPEKVNIIQQQSSPQQDMSMYPLYY